MEYHVNRLVIADLRCLTTSLGRVDCALPPQASFMVHTEAQRAVGILSRDPRRSHGVLFLDATH